MKPPDTDPQRALKVAAASPAMAALRRMLAHEPPVVLEVIEIFGAVMYRQGVMETLRAARKHAADDAAMRAENDTD